MYPYFISNLELTKNNKEILVELTDEYNKEFIDRMERLKNDVQYNDENEYQEELDGDLRIALGISEDEEEEEESKFRIQDEKETTFQECTKCKVVKSLAEFYNPSWCKTCMSEYKKTYLANNPNARKADEYRRWLYNALNGKLDIDTKPITGLSLNELKAWMCFTKQYYIPKDNKDKIDIEHMYPLSKYDMYNMEDVKHCLNWKHLRYMTHEENNRKLNKPPTPADKLKQLMIVYKWSNST